MILLEPRLCISVDYIVGRTDSDLSRLPSSKYLPADSMDTKISFEANEKVGSTGLQEKRRRQRWGIEYLETGSVCSLFSTSTATMSNLPGAGRTLGNLYSKWGFALEESLGIFAHKRGFGPEAVADRISQNLQNRWLASYNGVISKEKFKRGIQKDCNKLIKHLR